VFEGQRKMTYFLIFIYMPMIRDKTEYLGQRVILHTLVSPFKDRI